MARTRYTLDTPKRSFIHSIEAASSGKRTWQVFSDFCECAALALANSLPTPQWEKREQRYHQLRESYRVEDLSHFSFALSCVIEALQAGEHDFLGQCFMEMDMGSHWHGQFFTPYELCRMMARMIFSPDDMNDKEFITVDEPACGAGGMLIGFAQAMRDAGFNYQRQLYVTATDIDPLCVHMCYVQLTLLHIPATIVHGNSLTLETWATWITPAYHLGIWDSKLRRRRLSEETAAPSPPVTPIETPIEPPQGQLTLF